MQLESLANSPHQRSPVITDRLTLASRMLRHSREEARRSVWDLRSRLLEVHGLAAAADHCRLTVEDDGCGFDPLLVDPLQPPHFGLLGLRERADKIAASLDIRTRPGHGCTVTVTVPVTPNP
jgi:signal transduction histidine kinase